MMKRWLQNTGGRSQLDCSLDHKRHDLSVKSIPLEGSRGISRQGNRNRRERVESEEKGTRPPIFNPYTTHGFASPTHQMNQTAAYPGRRGTRLLFRKSFPRWWTKNTSKPSLHAPRRKRGRLGFRTPSVLSRGWAEDNDNGADEDNFRWLEEEEKENFLPPSRRKGSLGGWVRIILHWVNESWITFTSKRIRGRSRQQWHVTQKQESQLKMGHKSLAVVLLHKRND